MTRTAVVLTGWRDWQDIAAIRSRLTLYPAGTVLVHGDCPTGADKIGSDMCAPLKFAEVPIPYFDWLGKAGGPGRNRVLIHVLSAYRKRGWDTAVEAFPVDASRGTKDCIRQANAAGFRVYVWGET